MRQVKVIVAYAVLGCALVFLALSSWWIVGPVLDTTYDTDAALLALYLGWPFTLIFTSLLLTISLGILARERARAILILWCGAIVAFCSIFLFVAGLSVNLIVPTTIVVNLAAAWFAWSTMRPGVTRHVKER
jgi:hypothetical protein